MELTPGVVIVVAVIAVVTFLLIRSRRREAASPVTAPRPPVRSSAMPAERESHSLVDWLLDRAFEQTGVPVANDALARDRIAHAAVKAMEELRTRGSATISLPFLTADAGGPKHFNVEFKRNTDSTFELQR